MSSFLFIVVSILLFLFILSVLVIAHELGHFLVAKKFGVRVDEFGLGYPPRAKKLFTWMGTVFTLNWLPFGGFVKIFGEDGSDLEQLSPEEKKQSFISKPKYVQAAVLVAGVVMNFLVGWLLVSGLYLAGTTIIFDESLPARYLSNTHLLVESVAPGTPADAASLRSGDIIQKVTRTTDGAVLEKNTPQNLTAFIRASGGVPLDFNIDRDAKLQTIQITPALSKSTSAYMIGITPSLTGHIKLSFGQAIVQGFHSSVYLIKETVQGLGDLITRKVSFDAVSGPVGMVNMVGNAAHLGAEYVILFAALISLSLAVINLVPFPALDGGRLLFVIIETIIRRPLPTKVTNILNTVGFFILIALMLLVTYHDIAKLVMR
jgi:regulator of sigma E protease